MPKLPAAKAAPDPPSQSQQELEIEEGQAEIDTPTPPAKKATAAKKAATPVSKRLATAKLSEINEKVNSLWYGDYGTGKSTDIATMANGGPTLIVNAEGGFKVKPLRDRGINLDNLHIFPDPDSGDTLTFDLLEDLYWQIKGDLEQDPKSWYGTGWDSVTEITVELLSQEAKKQYAKSLNSPKPRESEFFTALGDYGIMGEQVKMLLRRFRDLPCHFAVTALERRDQDDDGAVRYGPAVIPSIQGMLGGSLDIVCHTKVIAVGGEEEYIGQFTPVGKYAGKDRFGAMPKALIDPTFERIQQYVDGTLNADDDPIMQAGKARRAKAASAEKEEDEDA